MPLPITELAALSTGGLTRPRAWLTDAWSESIFGDARHILAPELTDDEMGETGGFAAGAREAFRSEVPIESGNRDQATVGQYPGQSIALDRFQRDA